MACAAKTYSGYGFTACEPCPAGYDCSTSKKLSEITLCPLGKFSLLGGGSCTSCAVGESCQAPDLDKDTCVAGTLQSLTVQSGPCLLCDVDKSCPAVGASAGTACAANKFAPPGTGAEGCIDCPKTATVPCGSEKFGNLLDCPTGTKYNAGTKVCAACTTDGKECHNNT